MANEQPNIFKTNNDVWVKRNAEQVDKIVKHRVDTELKTEKQLYEHRLQQKQRLVAEIVKLETSGDTKTEKAKRKQLSRLENANKEYLNKLEQMQQEAESAARIYAENQYKLLTRSKKREYQIQVKEQLEARKQHLLAEHKQDIEKLKKAQTATKTGSDEDKAAATREINELTSNNRALQEFMEIESAIPKTADLIGSLSTVLDRAREASTRYEEAEADRLDAITAEQEARREFDAAYLSGDKKRIKAAEDQHKAAAKAVEDSTKIAEARLEEANAAEKLAKKHKTLKQQQEEEEQRIQRLLQAVDNAGRIVGDWIETTATDLYGSQGKMQARLQGAGFKWRDKVISTTSNIGYSAIASQTNVVKQMEKLVDSGVAYNLELRAFLAETSENIASTFNAFDSNLLRIIRLQQADTTAARLGMESQLTELLNTMFKDTSYLTDAADSVSAALMDVSANMSRNDSLAFEYTAQKWLGALYSLGMSSQATSAIATGLQYLGTGNVTALSSNPALQTLFAMSASRGGSRSYADLLTGGLTSEDTNKLLRGMITYLAEIVQNQENQVTTSAYAELFGMSVTDLRTFASLTTSEIQHLYDTTSSYETMINRTESDLRGIWSKKSAAQIADTIIENVKAGLGANIGSNAFTYSLWKGLNVTDSILNSLVPGITVLGSGTTSEIDLINVAKLGFGGLGFVASLIEAIGGAVNGGASSLSNWNYKETTSRGSTLPFLSAGTSSSTSYSAVMGVGSASTSDITDVSFTTATQSAYDQAGVSSEEMQKAKETPQEILDAISGDGKPSVLSLLQNIDSKLDHDRVFYTAITGVLSTPGISQTVTNLSNHVATISATAASVSSSQEPTTSTVASTNTVGISGSSSMSDQTGVTSLEYIIATAVESAIRNIVGYSSGSGLPVTITNPNFGGM